MASVSVGAIQDMVALLRRQTGGPGEPSSQSYISCARPDPSIVAAPIHGSLTLQHLLILISAALGIITILATVFLSWRHLVSRTTDIEFTQICVLIIVPFSTDILLLKSKGRFYGSSG